MILLYCCLCLYTRTADRYADTIINGQAVCSEHASYAQAGDFETALRTVLAEERAAKPEGVAP